MEAIVIVSIQNCFILILLCLFSIFFYLLFFKKIKVDYNLPPSPPSLPIIGHLHHLLSLLAHKSFQTLSSKYGSLLYLRVFSVPIVLVSSPSIAYEIFGAQDVNVSTRNFPMHEGSLFFGSLGYVNAPYGEYWKSMKKLIVTKLLGPQALKRSQSVRAEELERFYLNLLDKAVKKESVEIAEEAMKLINNTICKMIMGRSCSEENGEAERVRSLVTKSDALAKKLFLAAILPKPLKKIGISLFKKELMDVSRKFDEVLEEILLENKEKLEEHQQGTNMMDELLEAYGDESAEYKITRDHIKSFFVDLFIAGTDTSTHTIQWIMAEIIKNSYIFERLREEIDTVVGKTRLIQETDIPNLPYLQATVKEGLRLHPPIPLVVRMFQERCKIGGFYVPEKTTLIVNGYAMMRDPEYWECPQEFKPERFLASSRSSQKDEIRDEVLKFIPFGSGRRGCPGANLAYVSVGTAIGVMVQCFDWKIKGDKINMNEAAGKIALTMAHPLKCTLVPRNPNPIPLTSILGWKLSHQAPRTSSTREITRRPCKRVRAVLFKPKAMKKESVEIVEEAKKIVNNSICNIFMGRICSEEDGEAECIRGLVTKSDTLTKKLFLVAILRKPLKKIGISQFEKELTDISHKFDELLEKILVEYEEAVMLQCFDWKIKRDKVNMDEAVGKNNVDHGSSS